MKANLLRVYNDFKEEEYNSCSKDYEYKKLLFSLAFYHSVILERRKFGAIGWNIYYKWMSSDLESSQAQIKMYLEEHDEVPFETLVYLIATINYGGRVTDKNDERLIDGILRKYLQKGIMHHKAPFSKDGKYFSPEDLGLEEVQD